MAVAGLIWQRTNIGTAVTGGKTVTAEFANSYKLQAHDSTVKEAGLEVGTVTKVAYTDHGTAMVTMKIDDDAMDSLGSHPSARIEPRTVLGGRYVVELHPGGTGSFDGSIPLAQTAQPVELDRVLEALPTNTRKALRGLVGEAGPTLTKSKKSLHGLLEEAPKVLKPASELKGGELLELPFPEGPGTRTVRVLGLIGKRVGAPEARLACEEITPAEVIEQRKLWSESRMHRQEGEQGRPTKKNRREIEKRRGFFE